MSKETFSRRNILKLLGASGLAPLLPELSHGTPAIKPPLAASSFTYCLNMSTIRGQRLGFVKELETASKAGFHSVEIWMNSLQTYLTNGGTITEAKKRIDDLGLTIENSIGFAEWIVNDDTRRKQGLELMKKEMDLLAQIGCKRTAAPPAGATETPGLSLKDAAARYHSILELGETTGVVPHLELWGFSKNLGRLSEVFYVAIEAAHPSAKVLLDVYHLYKGGSSVEALSLVNPASVEILHMNDYPAELSPSVINDADRIYPGDGIAPTKKILELLGHHDKPLVLSTEVFNKNYYSQDALIVAKTALEKMQKIVSAL